MAIDNLDDLRVMLATAETGSLTAAGKRCGLGTAAVSAALKRLERSFGARLFERSTRVVRLTAEGEILVEHARRSLDLIAQAAAQISQRANQLEGRVRLTASTLLTREVLAPWLADFAALHPRLEVELVVTDAVVDLVRDALDLALRHGPLPESSLCARLLAPARHVACASPAYLARAGMPSHPAELARHECLVYPVRGRLLSQWLFEPLGEAAAPLSVQVGGRLVSSDASVAHQWALEGRGVVYESELGTHAALQGGALVRLFPQHTGSPAPLYAVLPSNRFIALRVQTLVDELAAMFSRVLAQVRQAGGRAPA